MNYNRYTDFEENILDQETGLVWKRHPESGLFTFKQALQLENKEWRLPTIKELYSIVDTDEYNPATKLPNHTSSAFWSGSPNADHSSFAWSISFSNGAAYYSKRSTGRCVRLVRR